MAPLTLLVGDNSTGKTSFLAAVRAVWEVAYQQLEPDFRKAPYDLGGFPDIVHNPREGKHTADSFAIGFHGIGRQRSPIDFDVTFKSHDAAPSPSRLCWGANETRIECTEVDTAKATIDFRSHRGQWRLEVDVERPFRHPWNPVRYLLNWLNDAYVDFGRGFDALQKLDDTPHTPNPPDLDSFSKLLRSFTEFGGRQPPFAGAPIRSNPHRTYDSTRPSPDPEGANVPTFFAKTHYGGGDLWHDLKNKVDHFGLQSGLFDEIAVRQLGDVAGGPFQLQIRKAGEQGEGAKRNLMDVGYGVSQTLPVLAELFRPDASPMLLLQQPEVHLHPSAQAALGSLFCQAAASDRQLVIETHSDYIVDRVILDVRDKRADLQAEDVSILFFQREDLDVRIHSIRVDDEGNVLDAPEGYRRFFRDELNRVINY